MVLHSSSLWPTCLHVEVLEQALKATRANQGWALMLPHLTASLMEMELMRKGSERDLAPQAGWVKASHPTIPRCRIARLQVTNGSSLSMHQDTCPRLPMIAHELDISCSETNLYVPNFHSHLGAQWILSDVNDQGHAPHCLIVARVWRQQNQYLYS